MKKNGKSGDISYYQKALGLNLVSQTDDEENSDAKMTLSGF